MVRKDWTYVNLPTAMYDRINEFCNSEDGKRLGLTDPRDFIKFLIIDFLQRWETRKYAPMQEIRKYAMPEPAP
ncbi:MAG: hypothetical protein ACRD3Z_01370 [Nitrososphaerales archaeon]